MAIESMVMGDAGMTALTIVGVVDGRRQESLLLLPIPTYGYVLWVFFRRTVNRNPAKLFWREHSQKSPPYVGVRRNRTLTLDAIGCFIEPRG